MDTAATDGGSRRNVLFWLFMAVAGIVFALWRQGCFAGHMPAQSACIKIKVANQERAACAECFAKGGGWVKGRFGPGSGTCSPSVPEWYLRSDSSRFVLAIPDEIENKCDAAKSFKEPKIREAIARAMPVLGVDDSKWIDIRWGCSSSTSLFGNESESAYVQCDYKHAPDDSLGPRVVDQCGSLLRQQLDQLQQAPHEDQDLTF